MSAPTTDLPLRNASSIWRLHDRRPLSRMCFKRLDVIFLILSLVARCLFCHFLLSRLFDELRSWQAAMIKRRDLYFTNRREVANPPRFLKRFAFQTRIKGNTPQPVDKGWAARSVIATPMRCCVFIPG
ncbi:hypothetical protein QA635_39040 [Bradyrhizobium brasilense]|uniref:hypothetical protein n=1 Tax=Bradyrhizobium brasilense TaxID=1419277 RepID=UPI0024B03D72|nr:hypothetical protein [Bradyrhizobium australafricanum]WFU32410.1 hypothetical protein QA635_39040 [Bradyrhizobium australafricanum]